MTAMVMTRLKAKIHNALVGFPVNFQEVTEQGVKNNYYYTIGNIHGAVKKIPYDDFVAEFSILEEMAMMYASKLR